MGWLFRRGCNLHFLQGGTPGEAHALSRLFFVSVTKILTSDQTLFLIMGLILLCSFLIDTIASFIVFS